MAQRNKKQSPNQFARRWGLNKSRNVPKFNKSLFKTTKTKFNLSHCNVDAPQTKIQRVKTLPTNYDRSPSPEAKTLITQMIAPKDNPQTPNLSYQSCSIQQAEVRIDMLLQQKLKLLVAINKHKFFNKTRDITFLESGMTSQISKLNAEIEFLLANLKTTLLNPAIDCNYQKWGDLDKKIKMVEKVMAENESEVEIMRKYYTKVSHNVTTYRSFCHEPRSVIITKIKDVLSQPKDRRSSLTPTAKMPSNSTSRISYKLPNVQDYQKYRYKQAKPTFDQPVIQRSAYQTAYRPFIPPAVLPVSRRHSSLSIRPPSRNQTTSYQDQFKPLKQTPVNFKELDCYKDKFRNLKVSFHRSQQPKLVEQITEYINLQRASSRKSLKPVERVETKIRIDTLPTPRSTCHLDYKNINIRDRKICNAKPKNNRLDFLRTSFKKLINE